MHTALLKVSNVHMSLGVCVKEEMKKKFVFNVQWDLERYSLVPSCKMFTLCTKRFVRNLLCHLLNLFLSMCKTSRLQQKYIYLF